MAVMTAGLALNIPESLLFSTHHGLFAALVIIAAGSVVTCITRTRTVAGQLKEAP